MSIKDNKLRDLSFGRFAEDKACEYYIERQYTILERNWRLGKSEIDLIVQKDNVVIFIEVKARSGRDQSPIDAVTPDKKRRMERAADVFLKQKKGYYEFRFDIFTLTGDFNNYNIECFEDAFMPSLNSR